MEHRRRGITGLVSVVTAACLVVGVVGPAGTAASATTADTAARAPDLVIQAVTPSWLDPLPGYYHALGRDEVAVYVCRVPLDTTDPEYLSVDPERLSITPRRTARFANRKVTPYFEVTSRGRYSPVFSAAGIIALAADDGPADCLEEAKSRTDGSFTNVLAVDDSLLGGGFAGPGTYDDNWFVDPPVVTGRGAWVGGASIVQFPSASIVAHELGHTLHWPHSFWSPSNEYDNPLDIMSSYVGTGLCRRVEGGFITTWPCRPKNTLAYNRFLAGWIDGNQVRVHESGVTTRRLSAPMRAGTQVLLVPSATQQNVFLTLEARPASGFDAALGASGVAVHVVDQRPETCDETIFDICRSLLRRQVQAVGGSDSYDHVVTPGGELAVGGLSITVGSLRRGRYPVTVSGSFDSTAGTWIAGRAAPAEVTVDPAPPRSTR